MLFREDSRPTSHPIPTGIRALDGVGLAWHPGAQHLVLGRPRSGVSALLMEFAMRHLDLDPSHRVIVITEDAGTTVIQRLIRREALRLQRGFNETETPLLFPTARHHLAQSRIQELVESQRLRLIPAPSGSTGIRLLPDIDMDDQTCGACTLAIVDGYSVARTPLDRLREMIRCSAREGQGVTHSDPPLVISTQARTKTKRDWPSLSRWETEHLLILAESTIVLQSFSGTGRALYACVGWADPDVRPETVKLEIDEAGAISSD